MRAIDRRFFDLRLTVYGTKNFVPAGVTPYKGLQYIVGANPVADFQGARENDIAVFDGERWNFNHPKIDDLEIFDVTQMALKRWNGAAFVTIAVLGVPPETEPTPTGGE